MGSLHLRFSEKLGDLIVNMQCLVMHAPSPSSYAGYTNPISGEGKAIRLHVEMIGRLCWIPHQPWSNTEVHFLQWTRVCVRRRASYRSLHVKYREILEEKPAILGLKYLIKRLHHRILIRRINRTWPHAFSQPKHAFHNAQLCRCCIQPCYRQPVIHHHPSPNNRRPSIHTPGYQRHL